MDSDKQKLIGYLTIGGGVTFALGLTIWFVMVGGGAAAALQQGNFGLLIFAGLPIGLCLIGVVAGITGLSIGFKAAFGSDADSPVTEYKDCYVVACFILNTDNQTVFDPEMFDESELRYYVQVDLTSGEKREFRTSPEVYGSVGEGQRGTVTCQGNWLNQFVPDARVE